MALIATRQCLCCISEAAIASSASACLLSLSVHPGELPYIVITARPMLVLSLAIKSALIIAATARSASVFAAPSALSTNFCVSGGVTTAPLSRNIVPLQCRIARGSRKFANIDLKAATEQVDFLTIDGYDLATPDNKRTNEASPLYASNANPSSSGPPAIDATVKEYLRAGVPAANIRWACRCMP